MCVERKGINSATKEKALCVKDVCKESKTYRQEAYICTGQGSASPLENICGCLFFPALTLPLNSRQPAGSQMPRSRYLHFLRISLFLS